MQIVLNTDEALNTLDKEILALVMGGGVEAKAAAPTARRAAKAEQEPEPEPEDLLGGSDEVTMDDAASGCRGRADCRDSLLLRAVEQHGQGGEQLLGRRGEQAAATVDVDNPADALDVDDDPVGRRRRLRHLRLDRSGQLRVDG